MQGKGGVSSGFVADINGERERKRVAAGRNDQVPPHARSMGFNQGMQNMSTPKSIPFICEVCRHPLDRASGEQLRACDQFDLRHQLTDISYSIVKCHQEPTLPVVKLKMHTYKCPSTCIAFIWALLAKTGNLEGNMREGCQSSAQNSSN